MKSAKEVLNHLFTPYRHKIFPHKCLLAYLEQISPLYRKFIRYWSYKNGILLLYVANTNIKFHLTRHRKPLEDALSLLYQKYPICRRYLPVKEIKIIFRYNLPNLFLQLKPPPLPPLPKASNWERGNFKIETQNQKFREIFEEIREYIQAHHRKKEK